jgi:MFS family permease
MASAETGVGGAGGARAMFSALAHRNFRLFWGGAFLSNAGTWMQTVAQSWLVLQLTDSAFWLGVDSFVATAPSFLLTLLAGVVADLVDRKRLLILTQTVSGLSALALGAFVWSGVVSAASDVWVVLALTFVTGACWALAGPSYQAITVDLVPRRDLANAIALKSTQFQLARVIGPFLAAGAIKLFGLAGCFIVNGLSYAAIVAALASVSYGDEGGAKTAQAGAARRLRDRRAVLRDLAAGFAYVRGRPRVRVVLVCAGVVSLFGASYIVLIPVFARDVFGWGETGLALLVGTAGVGALCGALVLAYLGDFRRKGTFLIYSATAGGLCIAAFGLAPSVWLALPLLFAVGFSMVSFFAAGNTLLQYLVTDRMRGRVMSMWMLCFMGGTTFGNILAGTAAESVGPRATLAACGSAVALFAALVGAFNPRLREV